MPVTVDVPVRLRLDPLVIATRMDDIEGALSAALGRALENSRKEVLDPRGGYLTAAIGQPVLSWSGPGLAALSPEAATAVENCVGRALAEAVRSAGLLGGDGELPAPLGDAPSEQVDGERHMPYHGRYLVPEYQDGGRVALPVDGDPLPLPASVRITRWEEPQADWDAREWIETFVIAYATHPCSLGPTDWVGMVFRLGKGYGVKGFRLLDRNRVAVDTVNVLDGVFELAELHTMTAAAHGPHVAVIEVAAHLATDAIMSIRWLPESKDETGRRRFLEGFERGLIEHALAPERVDLVKALGPDAYESLVAGQLSELVDRLMADKEVKSFAIFEADAQEFLVRARSEAPDFLGANPLPLVGMTSEVMVDPETAAWLREQGLGDESEIEGGEEEGEGGEPAEGPRLGGEEGELAFPPGLGEGESFICEPLMGEPPVSELGADGVRLRKGINEIAQRLQIVPCEYPGQFFLHAASVLGARAIAVGSAGADDRGGILEPAAGTGNLGSVEFQEASTPARQLLRHLAATVPILNSWSHDLTSVYLGPEHRGQIKGVPQPASWVLHYSAAFEQKIIQSAAFVYGATCQVLMAQLLRASRAAIAEREAGLLKPLQAGTVTYLDYFEQGLLPPLERLDELMRWRKSIRDYEFHKAMAEADYSGGTGYTLQANWRSADPAAPAAGTPEARAASDWPTARDALLDSLQPAGAPAPPAATGHRRGELVDNGRDVGVDDGTGRIWTKQALESAIIVRRGTLESVEPLIKQFVDLPEVMERLRGGREHVRTTLKSILREMAGHNVDILREVQGSWKYSFRASRITESRQSPTVQGAEYKLQNIHLQAHRAIGDAFAGDVTYTLALRSLFAGELNRTLGLTLIEFSGLILVAILCPPLAVALGIGTAFYHYAEAVDREHLYGALINPELVLTRAEVEMELFAAKAGVALAFLPEVGNVFKGASTVVRTVAREGLLGATDVAGASLRKALSISAEELGTKLAGSFTKQLEERLARGLLVALAREIATTQFIGKFIELVMHPIVDAVERELLVTGAQGGIDKALEHRLALLPPAKKVTN